MHGVGFALMEEIRPQAGAPVATHLGDYKLPNIQDVPKLQTVLAAEPFGSTPYLGRGIGEISNCPTAGAIANAVYDAVGIRLFELPLTAEKVLHAMKVREGAS